MAAARSLSSVRFHPLADGTVGTMPTPGRRAGNDPWLSENPPEIGFYAFRAEGCTVDREEPIFASLQRCHRSVMEKDMEILSFTGTTDVRFFNLYQGTPATCYGPIGAKLHAPDEWVDLESVKNVTKVLALTAMDWCGVD